MRIFQVICLAIVFLHLAGCKPDLPDSKELRPDSLGGREINPDAPRYWKSSHFPLEVYISESFETEFNGYYDATTEKNPFEKMQISWEETLPNKELFTLDLEYVENFEPTKMSGHDDNQIGIYKSHSWYINISPTALAVTQFYAYRRNTGRANEHLEMIHADIVLNYNHHNFTMDEGGEYGFDLPTVVHHELGHLLGLGHLKARGAVMNSTISTVEVKRELLQADSQAIQDLYVSDGQNLTSADSGLVPSFSTDGAPHPQDGEKVQGMIELMADGSCRHYQNGKLVREHGRDLN